MTTSLHDYFIGQHAVLDFTRGDWCLDNGVRTKVAEDVFSGVKQGIFKIESYDLECIRSLIQVNLI